MSCSNILDYSFSCRTALHFACARNNDVMVKSICLAGANPNIADGDGKTPLHKVCTRCMLFSGVQHSQYSPVFKLCFKALK